MTVTGCAEKPEVSVGFDKSSFRAGRRCAPVGGDGGHLHCRRSNHEWLLMQGTWYIEMFF